MITQLFFGAPESETKFESPKLVLHRPPRSIQHSLFIPYLKGWSSAFLSLHWIIVLPDEQRLTFHDPSGQIQPWGRFLGFESTGPIQVRHESVPLIFSKPIPNALSDRY
ncbi:hypothetical protein AVEN_191372-1 [Araneus ventricosus]|uniref:Uncharacterized protein n=1 Tax=Araneus ventricosus TaxID=182803 RepID=A0A4Y2NBN2_ARAVE|nr:hypothetical protein AVEN_191372-1 [Araneus ventricosus]